MSLEEGTSGVQNIDLGPSSLSPSNETLSAASTPSKVDTSSPSSSSASESSSWLDSFSKIFKSWSTYARVGAMLAVAGLASGLGVVLTHQAATTSSSPSTDSPTASTASTTSSNSSWPPLSSYNSSTTSTVNNHNLSNIVPPASLAPPSLPGAGAVCGDGMCSFLERCSTCLEDCGACSQRLVIAHYILKFTDISPTSNISSYETEIQLAQANGIDAFSLQIDTWPGNNGQPTSLQSLADLFFKAADKVSGGFKLFFTINLQSSSQQRTDFNTAILASILARYSSHSSYLFLNGKRVLGTLGGVTSGEKEWDWYTWLYAQFQAGSPIYFMPAFINHTGLPSPDEIKSLYYYVDGFVNLDVWPHGNSTVQWVDNDLPSSGAMAAVGGDYIPGVSAWYASSTTVIGNHGLLAVNRWKDIVMAAAAGSSPASTSKTAAASMSLKHVYLYSWNDFSSSTYLTNYNTGISGSEYNQTNYNHLKMLHLQSYFITKFKTGSYPVLTSNTIYYFYRLTPSIYIAPSNLSSSSLSPPPAPPTISGTFIDYSNTMDDAIYVVCLLAAADSSNNNINMVLQVNSGDKMQQWNVSAGGMSTFSTLFDIGVQTVTLTKGPINLLSSTGQQNILLYEQSVERDHANFNYVVYSVTDA